MTDISNLIGRLHTILDHLRTGAVGQREMWEEWLAEAADELDQLTGSKAALQTEIERLRAIVDGNERCQAEYLAIIEKKQNEIEELRQTAHRIVEQYRRDEDAKDAEIERLEHNQITASHTAIAQAAAIQAQHASASMREADAQMQRADALDAKCTQFTEALLKAMTLIDELLRENVKLCSASNEPPNVKLFTAKNLFDAAMHKLLGEGD